MLVRRSTYFKSQVSKFHVDVVLGIQTEQYVHENSINSITFRIIQFTSMLKVIESIPNSIV